MIENTALLIAVGILLLIAIVIIIMIVFGRSVSNDDDESGAQRLPTVGIMPETERGVVFTLGRARRRVIGPGIYMRLPFINRIYQVSMQVDVIDIPSLTINFEGGAPLNLGSSLLIQVIEARAALLRAVDYKQAISELAQRTIAEKMRGQAFSTVMSSQGRIEEDLKNRLNELTVDYGIAVVSFSLVDVDIPAALQDALVQEATAQADARADEIRANKEKQLATIYLAAARAYGATTDIETQQVALQLRRLASIEELGGASVLVSSEATG